MLSYLTHPASAVFLASLAILMAIYITRRYFRNPFANMSENELFSRLRLACIDEEPDVARRILKMGKIQNLNRFTAQSTLLCITSRGGSSELFRILLEYGADPNAKTQKGDTPLICAARNGHVECLEHLLGLGVDVDGRGHRGWTALHWASLNGRYEIAATLVAYGADIDCLTDDGASCIFLGCLSGHSNLVQDMIRYGANIHTVDAKGDTPLHAAARQNGSAVRPLIAANVPYQRNHAGNTPIDVALVRGHRKFVDLVLLARPHLRTTFHQEAIALASTCCNDTRTFQNILKVLTELATLEFAHFEANVEHITAKLVSLCPLVFAQSSSRPFTNDTPINAPVSHTTSPSKDHVSSSAPSAPIKTDSDIPAEPAINQFRHLANALVNMTHEVIRTPKISALLRCSNLRTKIQQMLAPLDSVWHSLESRISKAMVEWELSDRSEETKKKICDSLADVPVMIDQYYNISRMTLVNNQIQTWDDAVAAEDDQNRDQMANRIPSNNFLSFIDRCHDGLRLMISSSTNLLTGQLHFLLDLPTNIVQSGRRNFSDLVESLSFEQKRNWLRIKIETEQSSAKTGSKIVCDRLNFLPSLLLSCASQVMQEKPEDLRGKLFIKFEGEMGVGAGVQREWFQFMTQQLMSEEIGLFETASDRTSIIPISDAKETPQWTDEQRQTLFSFAGRLLAIAIVHEEHLDCILSSSICKSILNRTQCDLEDMKAVDETVYKSLRWMLENPHAEDLGISFEAAHRGTSIMCQLEPELNQVEDSDLPSTPIEVNDSNKFDYVAKFTHFSILGDSQKALKAIADGFHEIIPYRYVAPLLESELQTVVTGNMKIDLDDWKANTEYSGELDAKSEIVGWFWNWMDRQCPQMHRNVLQFVTGSTNLPLGGFKALRGVESKVKFNITIAPKDNGALPTASTCFNMLKFPSFRSQADFESKLELAVQNGRCGFSFN
jgi:E3 ubiquitin-protein ligase HACE1